MITLEQFYPLISRNTDVALIESGRQIFHGFSRSIPDDYWKYRVTDFRIVTDESIAFQVRKNGAGKEQRK